MSDWDMGGLRALVLAYLVPVLLAIAILTPAWQNPDEPFHMMRAVNVAHGGVLGSRAWGTAGGESDRAVYDAYEPVRGVAMHPAVRVDLARLAASGAVQWGSAVSYTPFPNTIQYGPAFYLPGAVAYWIGRAAGLSIDHTLLLARGFNAVLFALIVAAALGMARRTRLPLAALVVLPTNLMLAASASQDGLVMACTSLCVALLDRAIAGGRAVSRREALLLALLLACIGMARPPYAGFLALLMLVVPATQRVRFRLPFVAGGVVLAWCVAVAWHVSVKMGGSDVHRQLALLAADPGRIAGIVVGTARTYGVEYAVQFIGVLGWTDTRLPHAYIMGAAVVVALAGLAGMAGPSRRAGWPLAGAVFAVVTIFVLQYLDWTWPGQPVVTGILGRYFLPVASVMTLALPRLDLRLGKVALGAVAILAAVTPAVMLHALVLRYYVVP
jgi:uncharacterized membrane protein